MASSPPTIRSYFLVLSTSPSSRAASGVMFLAFLLHGLSLLAHEFLRGHLFVYGVQLHQLTPNSILHITCFITLYVGGMIPGRVKRLERHKESD
jgi:hypothetical protein